MLTISCELPSTKMGRPYHTGIHLKMVCFELPYVFHILISFFLYPLFFFGLKAITIVYRTRFCVYGYLSQSLL